MSDSTAGPDFTEQTIYRNWFDRFIHLDPLLLRGLLVAVAMLLAQVLGVTVIENAMIDAIINLFTAVSALVLAVWARPSVTPNAKVIVFKPNPEESTVLPGEATVQSQVELDNVVEASLLRAA